MHNINLHVDYACNDKIIFRVVNLWELPTFDLVGTG